MAVALLACASFLAQAQTQPPVDDGAAAGDPPSRVARLSYRTGDVGLLPAGEKDWGDASLNRPLTTGDRLSTGNGARAELELGDGTLRMADDSDAGFLTLNDQLTQVELTQGTLNLSVRNLADGQSYEIDTPTLALVVDQPGTYRVDISEDGKSTRITDFDGRATIYGEGGAQRLVTGGRSYEVADASLNEVTISDISGGDDFDAWCSSRDQRYAQTASSQYVSPDVVGAQDLDQYGNWEPDTDYGQVWYPAAVGVDWAPYRTGHWAYVGPWGWSWVDDAPWGFAPYHYGRWAHIRGRWGWVPGPIGVRPVYAPALVAFVGGPGFSVSIGSGPIGWFPLGPGEIYNPWYRVSRGYYTNVNISNIYLRHDRAEMIRAIDDHYRYFHDGRAMPNERFANRDVPRAFTAMAGHDFVAARDAQRHMVAVDPHRFASAPVAPRGIDIRPQQASFAPPRPANLRNLPAGGFQREVVARSVPAAPFANRAAGVASAPRASFQGPTNVRMLNATGPSGRPGNAARAMPSPTGERAASAPGVQSPVRGNESAAMRPGELPSARFARPQPVIERAAPAERPATDNQPRPGVSYIPNAAEDRAARMRSQPPSSQNTLPSTPRFERAPSGAQEPRYAQPPQRVVPQQPQGQGYQGPQRGYEPPRNGYEPPRGGYQPPRANPPPNGGQREPQGHEEHHPAPPPRREEQQHP